MIYVFDDIFSSTEISMFKDFVENQSIENRPYSLDKNYKISFMIRNKLKQCFVIPEKWSTIQTLIWSFITETDEKSGRHKDNGLELYSKYTVITFLTDDFEGGEIVFDTQIIKPKVNRTVIFDKDEYREYMNIKNGKRLWIGTEITVK